MINYYLLGINIISMITFYIDKRKAIKKKYRVSEKTLIALSLIGGCYGSLIGMYLFRHKTQTWYYVYGIPVIFIIQIIIFYYLRNI